MDQVTVKGTCPFCNQPSIIQVDKEKYEKWKSEGLMVQDVFPELSPGDREMLISGSHAACFDKAFMEP